MYYRMLKSQPMNRERWWSLRIVGQLNGLRRTIASQRCSERERKQVQNILSAFQEAQSGHLEKLSEYLDRAVKGIQWQFSPSEGLTHILDTASFNAPEWEGMQASHVSLAYEAAQCFPIVDWRQLKNCPICGSFFYGGGDKKRYCSDRCRIRTYQKKPPGTRRKDYMRVYQRLYQMYRRKGLPLEEFRKDFQEQWKRSIDLNQKKEEP